MIEKKFGALKIVIAFNEQPKSGKVTNSYFYLFESHHILLNYIKY